ncbi:hypothetical protein HRI_004918100 [Hibiscus trionum]|uniref:Uncharacterized protein n=1 Tax=Hibiscus trionum TaxID=183268 RepID=A0A9W7MRS3_HIBTR|nr:hypothetical protein HRI_004918100 [Hibiscus trionum]
MEETNFTQAPSVFNGQNYKTCAIRMTVHMQALDVCDAVEEDYEITPLPANPTVAQMKNHREKKTKKAKAKSCLFFYSFTINFYQNNALQLCCRNLRAS